jgi:mRNA interferase YafQ
MRKIESSTAFKRDFKRLQHDKGFADQLRTIVVLLAGDGHLPSSIHDHALKGEWAGCRECHIRPDLLLIYEKEDGILRLARIGSHSHLFG